MLTPAVTRLSYFRVQEVSFSNLDHDTDWTEIVRRFPQLFQARYIIGLTSKHNPG